MAALQIGAIDMETVITSVVYILVIGCLGWIIVSHIS